MPSGPLNQAQNAPPIVHPTDAPGVARVVSNERLTPLDREEARLLVLDVGTGFRYREGQAVGIVAPGAPDRGHASALRFYSIASPRDGDDGAGRSLSICVKRVRRTHPETGQELPSVTGSLCGLVPGDEVGLAGPFGGGFLLPEDPGSNLILVATGTGIAPFRGFLRHIYRPGGGWTGEVRLYDGSRTSAECLFREELEEHEGRGLKLRLALSQEEQSEDGRRMHVHHRMAEDLEELWALLDRSETYLYMCGVKGMEEPVERLLESRAHRDGISWRNFHRMLQDTGRLRVETY